MQPRIRPSQGILLDTHIWVQLQGGLPNLSKTAREAIDIATPMRSVYIHVISAWEVAMLTHKKRLQFDRPVRQWIAEALEKPGIQVLPFTSEVAIEAALLPEPMHNDPADRMIVASALVERLTLITCDRSILKFAKHIGLDCVQG